MEHSMKFTALKTIASWSLKFSGRVLVANASVNQTMCRLHWQVLPLHERDTPRSWAKHGWSIVYIHSSRRFLVFLASSKKIFTRSITSWLLAFFWRGLLKKNSSSFPFWVSYRVKTSNKDRFVTSSLSIHRVELRNLTLSNFLNYTTFDTVSHIISSWPNDVVW